jgi:hypothetical protein
MRTTLRLAALLLALGAAGLAGLVSLRRPSLDREWDEDVAVLAGVEVVGEVRFTNLRDWSYTRDAVVGK